MTQQSNHLSLRRFSSVLASSLFLLLSAGNADARMMRDGLVIDPESHIRADLLSDALGALDRHADKVERADKMIVVDYALHSSRPRLFIVDLRTGAVKSHHVAHGSGSDRDHDGWLDSYSNTPRSNATSRGSYVGAERYVGKHGKSLRLDGLDAANSNARDRAIVLHAQPRYVSAAFLSQHGKLGRSNGCLVVYKSVLETVTSTLENGAFLYVDGLRTQR